MIDSATQASHPPAVSLRDQLRGAAIWRSDSEVVGQLITWISTSPVIRILSPRGIEFGGKAADATGTGSFIMLYLHGADKALPVASSPGR